MARDNVKMTKIIKFIESKMNAAEDEEIVASIGGTNDEKWGELAVTKQRLIFGSKTLFSGEAYEEVHFEQMASLDYTESYQGAVLKIYIKNSSRVFEFKCSAKSFMRDLRDDVKDIIDRKTSQTEDIGVSGENIVTELEKLAKLKEEGHLSEAEFEAFKRKLLT